MFGGPITMTPKPRKPNNIYTKILFHVHAHTQSVKMCSENSDGFAKKERQ